MSSINGFLQTATKKIAGMLGYASSLIPFRNDDNLRQKFNIPQEDKEEVPVKRRLFEEQPRTTPLKSPTSPQKWTTGIGSSTKLREKKGEKKPIEEIRKFCEGDFQRFYEANRAFDESTGKFSYDPNGLSNTTIVTFFEFMNRQPVLGVKILLWLDTFHDFKTSRNKYTLELNRILNKYLEKKEIKYNDYYKLYNENLDLIRVEKEKFDRKKEFSILSIYRDGFFVFPKDKDEWKNWRFRHPNDNTYIFPLSEACQNTFINECYLYDKNSTDIKIPHECAMIMFDLSNLFISTPNFEFTLLYSYIILPSFLLHYYLLLYCGNLPTLSYFYPALKTPNILLYNYATIIQQTHLVLLFL